jgi:hypothetical protein
MGETQFRPQDILWASTRENMGTDLPLDADKGRKMEVRVVGAHHRAPTIVKTDQRNGARPDNDPGGITSRGRQTQRPSTTTLVMSQHHRARAVGGARNQ